MDDKSQRGDALAAQGGYTVLARRYRPQAFDECVGQEHVAEALGNAIENNRVAHAYLFTGSRGVGKTSMARIFAKALDCEQGPTTRPCGECDICQSIATGEDVDVIEIDGASNGGVDQIRELRQAVNYRPSRARYKIYIIDEVHMVTNAAFNALLKTLEEPPPHTKFIFATTDPQKIPITILSRCQRFDFAGIEQSRIQQRLRDIVQSEGMQADEEALEVIARRAGGSMRDSQSLLDQVLAFGGDRLTAQDVHRVMGTAGEERVEALATAVFSGDTAEALGLVETAVNQGVQLGEWIEQLLNYLRDLMVLTVKPDAPLVSMPERLRASMTGQARSVPTENLLEMMDLLAACRARMKASTYGRTLVEMTVVRLCTLDRYVSLDVAMTGAPQAASTAPPQQAVRPAAPPVKKKPAVESEPGAEPVPTAENEPGAAAVQIELTESNVGQFWSAVCERLDDAILTAMLAGAQVVMRPPATLVVRFSAAQANRKSHCEDRLSRIEEVCREIAGKQVPVRFEREPAAATTSEAKPPPRTSVRELMAKAAKNPIVQQAEQVLNAKLIGVDQIPTTKAVPIREGNAESDNP